MALKDILKEVAGTVVGTTSTQSSGNKGEFKQSELPWNNSEKKDSFFPEVNLETERADGIYPYRLVVIDARDNSIVGSSNGSPDVTEVIKSTSNTGGVQYLIGGVKQTWEFVLPITPQQLSVTDQFAINTSATMRGIVEEHNGLKFKMISASGTTGIWPTRTNFEDPNSGTGISLFGGTAEALGGVARALDSFGGKSSPDTLDFESDNGGMNTGYFQAMLLQQFIERYAMEKKKPKNKNMPVPFIVQLMDCLFFIFSVKDSFINYLLKKIY